MKTRLFPLFIIAAAVCLMASVFTDIAAEQKARREREASEQKAREESQKFLDAIPHRLELPDDGDFKTHVIDMKTFEIAQSLDGWFVDYWPDLDIIVTESKDYEIYYVDGEESRTKPENPKRLSKGYDYGDRTDIMLWNRETGEKIRTVPCDCVYSPWPSDVYSQLIIDRKVLAWNRKTDTTTVIDLATGETVVAFPGYVDVHWKNGDFLLVLTKMQKTVSIVDAQTFQPLCTVPGGRVQFGEHPTRFVVYGWRDEMETVVYELKTGKKINTFPKGLDADLNHDGTKLLVRGRPSEESDDITLWNVDTGEKLWSAPFAGEGICTFRYSADEKIITGNCEPIPPLYDSDWQTYVWDAQTGEELGVYEGFYLAERDFPESGLAGRREETPPEEPRFNDIVWETEKYSKNIVFRKAEDGQAFLGIQLPPAGWGWNEVAPIRFTEAGDAMFFSYQVLVDPM